MSALVHLRALATLRGPACLFVGRSGPRGEGYLNPVLGKTRGGFGYPFRVGDGVTFWWSFGGVAGGAACRGDALRRGDWREFLPAERPVVRVRHDGPLCGFMPRYAGLGALRCGRRAGSPLFVATGILEYGPPPGPYIGRMELATDPDYPGTGATRSPTTHRARDFA